MTRRYGLEAITGALALTWLLAVPSARAADPASGISVRYEHERLSIRATDAPLPEVLAELARVTGAEIGGRARPDAKVTADFENLPLVEALEHVLGNGSFALRHGKDGSLRAIVLVGDGSEVKVVATAAEKLSTVDALSMLQGDKPLPVEGTLRGVLGTDSATFREIGDQAIRNPDGAMRREAMAQALRAIEGDAQIRQAVVDAVQARDDAALLQYLAMVTGARTEDVLAFVSSEAHDQTLRSRAGSALSELRRGAAQSH